MELSDEYANPEDITNPDLTGLRNVNLLDVPALSTSIQGYCSYKPLLLES
jgi:hypothetical protein